jgi:hypothetical protein
MIIEFKDYLETESIDECFEVNYITYLLSEYLKTTEAKNIIQEEIENENNPRLDKDTETEPAIDAKEWYKQVTTAINSPRTSKSETLRNYRKTSSITLGRVFAFRYDPKHKAKLKFFDENPLVIPFGFKDGIMSKGFLGINLHFIPRYQRKAVMLFFMNLDLNKTMKQGELNVDYNTKIKNNPRFPMLKFCIRMYLLNHVVGQFYMIPQEDYIKIIDLYSGQYVGMSEQQIVNLIKNMKVKNIFGSERVKKAKAKKEIKNVKRKENIKLKKQKEQEEAKKIQPTVPKKAEKEKITGIANVKDNSQIEPIVKPKTNKKITGNI